MSNIIGHERTLSFFNQVIAHERLSHAYCLVGPTSVGKRTMAETVAAQLLGVPRSALSTYPDVMVIEQERHEKTGKTKKDIDIEQLRRLRAFLSQRPFLGVWKVGLIDGAQKLNAHAANALLKTLEEPRSQTVIFLTTIDDELLPETIRSRCQVVSVPPVPTKTIQEFLVTQNVTPSLAEEMARYAQGRPGRVVRWLEDTDRFVLMKEYANDCISLTGLPLYEKMARIEGWTKETDDHIVGREHLQDRLAVWQVVIRDMMVSQCGVVSSLVKKHEQPDGQMTQWLRTQEAIRRAKALLAQNVHPRLALEHVILTMP